MIWVLLAVVAGVGNVFFVYRLGLRRGRVLERREIAMERLAGKSPWVFKDSGVWLYAMSPDGVEVTCNFSNRSLSAETRAAMGLDSRWRSVETGMFVSKERQHEIDGHYNNWVALNATKARES